MGKFNISDFSLYKSRYSIGYGLVAAGLIFILILAGLYLPGGLSSDEMQSIIISGNINFGDLSNFSIVNLPYHLLQAASLAIFGISVFSIKLPSIILAFISAVGLLILLNRWFRPRIGILATLIAITTGQFIYFAQNGTAEIMFLFWPIILILLADLISRQERNRTILIIAFSICSALSLYTPLSIYIIVAIIIAILIHPHLRYLFKKSSRSKITAGIIVAFILILPIIISGIKNPSSVISLLGLPESWPNLIENAKTLGAQYLGFYNPGGSTLMTPFFELGSMILIIIGGYYVIKTKSTAKSYVMIIWIICLLPFIVLNPNLTGITYLPLVMLLASGLKMILGNWYNMFPFNPYARIAGLIPIIILVSVLVISGIDRYIYGYRYDPNIVPNFSRDLKILPKDQANLVVGASEFDFYSTVAKYRKNLVVSKNISGEETSFTASRLAKTKFDGYYIEKIITSNLSDEADRFYLYKKIVK